MQKITELSEQDIRDTLIARATVYAGRAHTSLSAIGLAAVNDAKFLGRVQNGLGFNIKTYQKVMDWLDAAERETA